MMLERIMKLFDREDGASSGAARDVADTITVELDESGKPVEPAKDTSEEPEPSDTGNRASRRRDRYSAMREREEEARRQLEEARMEAAELRGRMAGMAAAQTQGQRQQEPQQDTRWAALQREQRALELEYERLPDDEKRRQHETFQQRAYELQGHMIDARIQAAAAAFRPDHEKLAREAYNAELMREHGDVFANQKAQALARSLIIRKVEVDGRQPGRALDEEVFDEVRQMLNMPRRGVPPTRSQRAATYGMGVTRGSAVPDEARKLEIPWNRDTQAMANAAYAHIKDPEERKRRWIAGQIRHSK